MLRLTKETLAELTSDDLASIVGGLTCVAASCITSGTTIVVKTSVTTYLTQTSGEL